MTLTEFNRRADAHNMSGRTREALCDVMVYGFTAYRAAKFVGVSQSAISRARKVIEDSSLCPTCHGTGRA